MSLAVPVQPTSSVHAGAPGSDPPCPSTFQRYAGLPPAWENRSVNSRTVLGDVKAISTTIGSMFGVR